MTISLDSYFGEIEEELIRQESRFGIESDDTVNTPWMWAAYIGQYATKWMIGSFAPIERDVTDVFRTCMIKVATLAVAAAFSLDRQRAARGSTFYEKGERHADPEDAYHEDYTTALLEERESLTQPPHIEG